MDAGRSIAGGNRVDNVLAALMRRLNVSTAARYALHNGRVGTDAVIRQRNADITEVN